MENKLSEKLLFIDVETTAVHTLNDVSGGIWQFSGIVVIDGIEQERFNFEMFPGNDVYYEPEVMEFHKLSKDDMNFFDDRKEILDGFEYILSKYVDKFDKKDKFTLVGYNVRFDVEFLREWFLRCGNKYFGSWFWSNSLDVMTLATLVALPYRHRFANFKLHLVAKAFGIVLEEAHNSASDIDATYLLYNQLMTNYITLPDATT